MAQSCAVCVDDVETNLALGVAADQAMRRVKARHKQRAQTLSVEAAPVKITPIAPTDAPPANDLASCAVN